MSRSIPTKEAYDSLIYKLATLESELGQARKLLEAPPKKTSWWKRYWGGVAVVAMVMFMVGGAVGGSGKFGVHEWKRLNEFEKMLYVMGYSSGMATGASWQEMDPKGLNKFVECVDKWTYEQAVAILDKYLRDNPHKWDKSFHLLVSESMRDACKKR